MSGLSDVMRRNRRGLIYRVVKALYKWRNRSRAS